MSDKSVYAWIPKFTRDGMTIGGMISGEHLIERIFEFGRPLDESLMYSKKFKGIQLVIEGTSKDIVFSEAVHRTLKWAESPYPIPYTAFPLTREELEKIDTPGFVAGGKIPIVSKKVLDIMLKICPDEFEYFPIVVETKTENSHNYFLINITQIVNPALDLAACMYKVWKYSEKQAGEEDAIQSFTRLLLLKGCMKDIQLGRLYDHLSYVMVGGKLIEAFKVAKVSGFKYLSLEDEKNQLYTYNYLSDGKTLIGHEI